MNPQQLVNDLIEQRVPTIDKYQEEQQKIAQIRYNEEKARKDWIEGPGQRMVQEVNKNFVDSKIALINLALDSIATDSQVRGAAIKFAINHNLAHTFYES